MTRDEYREEAILWLNRKRAYEGKYAASMTDEDRNMWEFMKESADKRIHFLASLAGLESIEELEE